MLVKTLLFNDRKRRKKKNILLACIKQRKKVVTDLVNGEQMYKDRRQEKHGRYRKFEYILLSKVNIECPEKPKVIFRKLQPKI